MTTILKKDHVFLIYHNFDKSRNLGGATFAFEGTPSGWRVGYAVCLHDESYVRSEGRCAAIDRLAGCAEMPWSELVADSISKGGMPPVDFFTNTDVQEMAMVATLKAWPEFRARYTRSVLNAALARAREDISKTVGLQLKAMAAAKYEKGEEVAQYE